MYGWVKWFADGSKEVGTDTAVKMKQATWQGGRLSEMVGVELMHGEKHMGIFMPGIFWQSEDYEVAFMDSVPELKVRRIQKKIEPGDKFFIRQSRNELTLRSNGVAMMMLEERDIGKWITIELDVPSGQLRCTIEETMI